MNIFKKYNKYLGTKSYEFSNGAKFVLLLFAFFIFFVIGFGIDMQLKGLNPPHKEYEYACNNILKKNQKFDIEYF